MEVPGGAVAGAEQTPPTPTVQPNTVTSDVQSANPGRSDSRNQSEIQSLSATEPTSETTDDFYDKNPIWKELMQAMQCFLDDHICRILDLIGYRSYAALKKINTETIKEIEELVKTGGILDRVDSKKHHLYLGGLTDASKFKFLPGERDLILSIVEYVTKYHKEKEKPILGKSLNAYPLFNKNTKSSPSQHCNKRLKTTETITVASLDFQAEVGAIKKLMTQFLIKNDSPDDYLERVRTMTITVKTMAKGEDAALSAKFNCFVCNGKDLIAGYRERNKTWALSNFDRHIRPHLKNKDKLPGSVNARFFQPRNSSDKNIEDDSFLDGSLQDKTPDITEENQIHDLDTPEELATRKDSSSSITSGNVNCNILRCEGESSTKLPNSISNAYKKNYNSRLSRVKRSLGRHTPNQTRITAYFPILNQIEVTLNSNKVMISELKARVQELTLQKSTSDTSDVSFLLKLLMETAVKNGKCKNHGQRYEEDIKLFSVYLFIIGGRMIYEFLHDNLTNSLPSISEVERILKKNSHPVIEGVFRFQELKEFLMSHELPLKVCISEDGTRIQQKFLYESTTNQIIGPVLPLAPNGLPIPSSYPATSAAAIATHMKNSILSSSAYAFLAQPIRKGAPSFCLCLFGTDNRFSAEHTFRRWTFIREELAKIGVEVECFSADGDPKMLSAMHSLLFSSSSNFRDQWKDWFYAKSDSNFTVIQDAIHTVNKFRARLNPSNFLPIGNFSVSVTHLKLLIKEESQEEHGLTEQDINNSDKMNFNASYKICSSRVTDLMSTSTPGSDATVAYLTNMRYVLEACLDDGLSAAERLYRIWHCAFFLRFWKLWLRNHKSYTMENFITSNLFVCIEVIAHALIIILIKFRESSEPELYLPSLFSSQPCESFFRLARSMTSTESTVINFSLKEFLQRVRRVDMLHHCVSKLSDKLEFPRDKRKKLLGKLHEARHKGTYLPNDTEILEIVMAARNDASASLRKLGVNYYSTTSLIAIQKYLTSIKNFEDDQHEANSTDAVVLLTSDLNFTEDDIPLDILAAFPSPDELPALDPTSTSDADESLPPNSIFTMVPKSGGGFVRIRKSTFCWLIASNGLKLSSDRLKRVRQAVCTSMSKLKLNSNNPASEPFVSVKKEVEVGEWCIFRRPNGSGQCVLLLGFRYLSGSGRSFTLPRAPVEPPEDQSKARGLGCLCTRYNHNALGELTMVKSSVQCYLNMDNYVASFAKPIFCDSKLRLPPQVLTFLSNV